MEQALSVHLRYTFQTGGNVSADSFIASGLADGWYVASPDFEGFNAAFTNGLQSGQATLDGLRAALNSNSITGIDSDAAYAIGGYSGGALGSEWAVELQPKYAPELKIAGAALGGLTPNVTSVLFTISGTAFAGLGPAGILGLSAQDPDFRAYVESLLVPANATTFEKALTQCLTDDIATFLGQDITNYFVGGAATLDNMNVTDFTEQYGIMGLRDTPTVPLYVYKGVQDQISVIADTDALVNKYCATAASGFTEIKVESSKAMSPMQDVVQKKEGLGPSIPAAGSLTAWAPDHNHFFPLPSNPSPTLPSSQSMLPAESFRLSGRPGAS
ncbi:MAG: hypothetical protein Q9159_006397 [Coniocarpon cinnabarinum]